MYLLACQRGRALSYVYLEATIAGGQIGRFQPAHSSTANGGGISRVRLCWLSSFVKDTPSINLDQTA